MSNLEHLIENGLCRLDKGMSYEEWNEIMKHDRNWQGNENITLANLWEICQYVIYTWDQIKDQEAQRDYERAVEAAEYCEHYEQTYNPEDGSL